MTVGLCCIAKLENLYIKEFVEYYKDLGVDKIFIYDNNDVDGETFDQVIIDYIENGFVEVIDFRGLKNAPQNDAYNDCLKKHGGELDWICFFDCDEFLKLQNYSNIKDFLSDEKFSNFDTIHINWRIYDDNELIRYDERKLVERFTHPMKEDKAVQYSFPENNHIKSIVRGKITAKFTADPHTPRGNVSACDGKGKSCPNSPFNPYDFSVAYLMHFRTKTIEEFAKTRHIRGRADVKNQFYGLSDFKKHNEWTEEKQKVYEEITGKKLQ